MKCQKEPLTRAEANKRLQRIPPRDTGQVPVRMYWCPQHKAFHITSKPKQGVKNRGRQR